MKISKRKNSKDKARLQNVSRKAIKDACYKEFLILKQKIDVLHRVEEINLEAGNKKKAASENRDIKECERKEKLHAVAAKYVSNPSGSLNADELKLMLSGAKDKTDSPIKTRKGDLKIQFDHRVDKVTSMIRNKFPDLAAQLASSTNSMVTAVDGLVASNTVASA
jgi:hypothetical protein